MLGLVMRLVQACMRVCIRCMCRTHIPASPHELCCPVLSVDLHERGQLPAAQADASERLRAEFQERQAQLEQHHQQEVERLRSYYQQQAKETQERYATEVILLQQRLQELTGTEAEFRYTSRRFLVLKGAVCDSNPIQQIVPHDPLVVCAVCG